MIPPSAPLRVVIQARLSSTRLPAKALLPLGGLPLAALAARRAARDGAEVVLATSSEPSDDLLAAEMARQGLRVVRGPLDDVLARFLLATEDLPPDALVVRLTADNPCPDADFIARLAALRAAGGHAYLGYGGDRAGLPYGMAAEIFTVRALREAGAEARDPAEREHVTTLIRRRHGPARKPPFPGLARDWGHLRATVDSFEDYCRMARLFDALADPVAEPWDRLLPRLQALPGAPAFAFRPGLHAGAVPVLGTVQLGVPYGRANRTGLPDEAAARAILHRAIEHGVEEIDTARAYGLAEGRIGRALAGGWAGRARVLSKLSPLPMIDDAWPPAALAEAATASVMTSARELGLARVPVMMLHRAAHLDLAGGAIWDRLRELREGGVIGALGVSVQSPAELERALALPDLAHVQLPGNLLDGRWGGAAAALAGRPEVRVHVRGAFLQGLLARPDPSVWPPLPGLDAAALVARLEALVRASGRESLADLALAAARGLPYAHGVVFGVETEAQLTETLGLFCRPPLAAGEIEALRRELPPLPDALLDPARWPKR